MYVYPNILVIDDGDEDVYMGYYHTSIAIRISCVFSPRITEQTVSGMVPLSKYKINSCL